MMFQVNQCFAEYSISAFFEFNRSFAEYIISTFLHTKK